MKFQNINNIWLFCLIFLLLNACSSTKTSETSRDKSILEEVKQRGWLNCGVSGDSPGFSYVDRRDIDITQLDNEQKYLDSKINNSLVGFDVDICRAIAAAIFNDPNAVRYRLLDTKERFQEISSGQVDVLSRTTTWTLGRDVSIKLEFAPIVFYDGQSILVRKNSEVRSLNDLNDKVICVETETTTLGNLEDERKKRN
ncbi:MAG: transporter substrate-binding domain-containing protein, partial [Okeania sp. SIO3H1]|nr:transporter substrate-binding domain-containing protein [Okeania sp. SIO3H1]